MRFVKEDVMNAFDILTCQVSDTDVLGSECKKEVKDVLNEYFDKSTRKRVAISEKYGSTRCPKCNTTLIGRYDHYCRQCGQKLDWNGI